MSMALAIITHTIAFLLGVIACGILVWFSDRDQADADARADYAELTQRDLTPRR